MKLDIGGGLNPRDGYVNVDPAHGVGEMRITVGDDIIPLPDNSVDAAYASHVLEHIPSGGPRIHALNEIRRVLRPGAPFEIVVPVVGYTDHAGEAVHVGWQAWADPTHVSYWWYPESFYYLTGRLGAHASYGLALWGEGAMELRGGWEAHVTLVKPVAAT